MRHTVMSMMMIMMMIAMVVEWLDSLGNMLLMYKTQMTLICVFICYHKNTDQCVSQTNSNKVSSSHSNLACVVHIFFRLVGTI